MMSKKSGGSTPNVPRSATRREFIQLMMAAGISVPVAQGMWTKARAAEPQRGGTFRIGIGHGSTNDTLDPAQITNAFTSAVAYGALRNALTVIGANGQIQPDLAESFEATSGAKRWVFKLKRGVEFHNGKSLTPQDVIESINHHRGENTKSAVKSLLAIITDLKADGPETVVVDLKEGTADFPYFISDWHIPIGPAKEGGGVDWSGNGTGPFVLESFEPGVKASMKRYANYHHEGRPYFDSAEAYAILDVTARLNALTSGTIDYADRADPKLFDLLKQEASITPLAVKGYSHFTAPMNGSMEPFNDPNVRLAVKHAIDREQIVKTILHGYGSPGNDNPIAEGIPYRIDPQPVHNYDPDKARSLLKKAGLQNLKLSLSTADAAFVGAVDTGALMKETAAKAGIEIEIVREANDGYWSKVWMKKPWCMGYWNGRATCDWLFSQVYASNSPWNEMTWKNERFDKLMAEARPELDQKKRAEKYAEMQQLIHDDSSQLVLMFNDYLGAHSQRLAHPDKIAANLDQDGFRIFERWWFAS